MIRAGAYAEGTMHEQDVHLVLSWELLSKRDCMQVPVLFDKKTKTIVSNESADIIRMFATECQVCPPTDSPAFQDSYDISLGHCLLHEHDTTQ